MELAREIEQQFDYPLILRTLVLQEGKGMTKVDSREVLVGNLASGFPEAFFVTQFVDSRGENEFFRKIRAAVVKDEIIIMRVDCDSNWNVHGRKSDERVAFYLNNVALLDQERAICAAPEEKLGRSSSSRSARFATGLLWMRSALTSTSTLTGRWFFTRPTPP